MTPIRQEIANLKNPEKAAVYKRFFKTGKGEYGEGDVFLGLTMGEMRQVTKKFKDINMKELKPYLKSKIHEERMVSFLILVHQFEKAKQEKEKEKIYNFYFQNIEGVNNWDLVDLTAPRIAGMWLLDKDRKKLYEMARSKDLWKKRIGILSTYTFIKEKQFDDTLAISEILLEDKHDLIHKAVGWMLREIGNRNLETEEKFLKKHYKKMPRTMLRYAIEKFEENKRQAYLKGKIV